jgi:homoserine kinase
MSLVEGPVTVSVPATSANVGPGYDCLGIALGLRDVYTLERSSHPGVRVQVTGEGAGVVPADETNLVARSLLRGLALLGERPPAGLRLRCQNQVPHSRGLGSSSAAIVGGLGLGRELAGGAASGLTDADLLAEAVAIEGHPDNVTAAVLGGFTLGWLDEGTGRGIRMQPAQSVVAVIAVPVMELSTAAARAALPECVPLADAAANISRTALLCHAVTREPELLLAATEDRLHQQPRSSVYPSSYDLVCRLRAAGLAAVISGAGPTVLVLAQAAQAGSGPAEVVAAVEDRAGRDWSVRSVEFAAAGLRPESTSPAKATSHAGA